MDGTTGGWFDRQIAGCSLVDRRLEKRLRNLLERLGHAMGASIPLACQDWANTKAAYRFFSNERISEAAILAGHFAATRERFAATDGPILVLQDTTEFTFQRERAERIGLTYRVNSGKDKAGRFRMHRAEQPCRFAQGFQPANALFQLNRNARRVDSLLEGSGTLELLSRPEFDGSQTQRQALSRCR